MRVLKTFLFLMFSLTTVVYAKEWDYIREVKPCEVSIQSCIEEKAKQYNVSSFTMGKVIFCESSFKENAVGDNNTSFGLSQIHLPAHPNITKEEAFDREFAIEFMAKEMSEGRAWKWSCYKILKSKGVL